MDRTTHKFRIASWGATIEQFQARPEGQSAKQWLTDNGISEKSYYYWQRRVRQETYALISSKVTLTAEPESVAFAELPFIGFQDNRHPLHPDAMIRRGHAVLELSNTISDRFLNKLMEVVIHALKMLPAPRRVVFHAVI